MDTSTVSVVVKSALDYAYSQDSNFIFGVERSGIETAMQAAIAAALPSEVHLGTTKPDFEAIYLRLVQELQTDDTWYDIIQSSTGQTLLRNICSGISYALFAVERAQQESFLHSANATSSILMASRMLGVRPQRRLPASVSVRLTRPDQGTGLTIERFAQFTINNTRFFTREPITFNEFELNMNVMLVQGVVLSMSATAEGLPFERLEFGSENGLISDQDVYVFVDDVEWTRKVNEGPHNFGKNETCFYESTLPNSNVEIQFGNRAFGRIPTTGANIVVKWAETEGANANFATSGLTVTLYEPPSGVVVDGVTTGSIQYGSEALSTGFYKAMAPHVRASNRRAVRRADYREKALEYPGVIDALFRGQAELNPGRRNWMNIVGATILMKDGNVMTATEWTDFVNWMQVNYAIYQCEFLRLDPTAVPIDITADVFCKQNANLTTIKNDLLSNITEQYGPRMGILGYSVYHSDIADLLEGTGKYDALISYCTNVVPATDTIVTATQWVKVNSVTLNMYYTTRDSFMGRLDLLPPTTV